MLNIDIEIWKPVPGFELYYEVSSFGNIRNSRKRIMKPYVNNKGYHCIDFQVNSIRTKHLIHRLVLLTFTPNPDNLPEVNHIDEDKSNNNLSNLEWCTRSYNKQHSMQSGTYNKIYTQKNALGKKHKKNTASKYHNVSYDKDRNKWTACIIADKKRYGFKRFDTENEAALHVNYIIDTYGFSDRPKNIVD